MSVSFKVTPVERIQIDRIAKLATEKLKGCILLNVTMDITACHANGCRLDLHAMLESSEGVLFDDLRGITENLNRETGELENGFVPYFAAE